MFPHDSLLINHDSIDRTVQPRIAGELRGGVPLLNQRRAWWIILATFGLLLAACGSTTSSQHTTAKSTTQASSSSRSTSKPSAIPTTAAQAGCTIGELAATMSGHLTKSCYRIPNLASGTYYLGMQAELPPRGAAAVKLGFPVPSGHSGPAVSLTVSPSSVSPGASVTITGRVSTSLKPQPSHVYVCFDGCVDGLHYDGTPVHWLSSTEFQTSFVTPSGPWLERYPLRLVAPKAGSYPVAIQCLGVHRGCALAHGGGSTTVTFKRSTRAATPQLTLSKTTVLPGEMTSVKGAIALSSIIGTNEPFIFEFTVLDKLPSTVVAHGVYQLPRSGKGGGGGVTSVLLSPVKFRVATPLTYQSVSLKGATNIQSSADPSIVTERGTNGVALTCSGQTNAMRLLSNGHVSVVNTNGVIALLEQHGVTSAIAGNESCSNLAAVHTPAGKTLIAASYAIGSPNQAPNFNYLPVISADDGATWTTVPTPSGATGAIFGGLQASRSGIQAYFTVPHHAMIAETTDNGTSWTQEPLLCPRLGPCIRFSPTVNLSNCAMNGAQQSILLSTNQGRSFTQSNWPSTVNACGLNELFSVHGTEYLVDPQSSYPLRRSTDGGLYWQVVSGTPTPPGVLAPGESSPLGQTIWSQTALVLPGSGDLLSVGSGTGSFLLAPHARHWCNIATTVIPKNVGGVATGEHSLYFVTYSNSSTSTSTFASVPLTNLHCAS